ncbi:MAG: hypothetical protein BV456_10970 [Thermoplasmata archaeon M8B2D]|nr:MAG: hypothetical protein BV456_10970 [Thermoplasmata archaeon M8B2D]
MRPKTIIIGLIVLIIGILLFAYGYNYYNFYEQKNETSYLEIPNTNDNVDVEKEMAFGTTVEFIGVFILVLSIILLIIGFFRKEK